MSEMTIPESFPLHNFEIVEIVKSRFGDYTHRKPIGFYCPACNRRNDHNGHGSFGRCPCGIFWQIYGNGLTINNAPLKVAITDDKDAALAEKDAEIERLKVENDLVTGQLAALKGAVEGGIIERGLLRDDLAAARKVIERLPKTADGVPIEPGNTYYDANGDEWPINEVGIGIAHAHAYVDAPTRLDCSRLYSTREAAAVAKPAQRKTLSDDERKRLCPEHQCEFDRDINGPEYPCPMCRAALAQPAKGGE